MLFVEWPAQAARAHNRHQSISALLGCQCGCLCVEQRKEAESKEAPLEGGLGGEPETLIENSWGGWGGTTC